MWSIANINDLFFYNIYVYTLYMLHFNFQTYTIRHLNVIKETALCICYLKRLFTKNPRQGDSFTLPENNYCLAVVNEESFE